MNARHLIKACCILLCSVSVASAEKASDTRLGPTDKNGAQVVAGYVEWAFLENATIAIKAKLDTGAKSSSINAVGATQFTRSGKDWVRLSIKNSQGDRLAIERPIVRFVRIRRANTAVSERPVIEMNICVAGVSQTTEVTLAIRAGMNYQLLIGRSFLRSGILVDSNSTYLRSDKCR